MVGNIKKYLVKFVMYVQQCINAFQTTTMMYIYTNTEKWFALNKSELQ